MKSQTSFSTEPQVADAVAQIERELRPSNPRALLYFASSHYPAAELAAAMAAAFPGVPAFGCSTAGEIVTGRMLERSIVAMALGADLVKRVAVAVVPGVSSQPAAEIKGALNRLACELGCELADLGHDCFFGLVLIDGLSGAEEAVISAIGDATNLTFVGGSAGDNLAFARTHVFAGAQASSDAALLVLVEAAAPFEVVKTQSFSVSSRTLTATHVDITARRVLEFDGQPAAQAYASALGVPVSELASQFMTHPLGLVVDGEPFVRSPQRVEGDAVHFYCQILPGTELHVLEGGDIVSDTSKALAAVPAPVAWINFHCILRTLELKEKEQCAAYAALFRNVPTIGLSTYGEAYIGHINQTSTILAFKASA